MTNVVEFNLEPRIVRQLEKLEEIHIELDRLYANLNGVEESLSEQQEIFDNLLQHWKDPVPVLWKLYATNQTLTDEDFLNMED